MKTIAIDPGAGAIKLFTWGDGEREFAELPSVVATNGAEHVSELAGLRTSTPPQKVNTSKGTFLVGNNAHKWGQPIENLDPDRFTGAPEMEALLCAAMSLLYPKGILCEEVKAIVGLPLDILTGEDAVANANAVKAWVTGNHMWEIDDDVPYDITIKSVKVTSQPVGALFDWLLDIDGHYIPERKAASKGEIGIISIGMNSVEMLSAENMTITQRYTAGRAVGVRRMLEILNPDDLYSRGEMDIKLRFGDLDYSAALPIWASEVSDVINKRWGNGWKRFKTIIVTGGGALLLRSMLTEKFKGRAWFPPDPVLSIAAGLWKVSKR